MLAKRFGKMLNPIFSLNKCWCNYFPKILVQLFMKNVGSTFCLKNHFLFNSYELGWLKNNKHYV
jgi:hypothetical protein